MSNKKFIEETKKMLKGVSADSYYVWSCLNNSKDVQYFCMKIFQNFIDTNRRNAMLQNQQSMLTTLLILQFYKNNEAKGQQLVIKSKKLLSLPDNKIYGFGAWIIEIFFYGSSQMLFAKDFLSHLINAPIKITWQVEPGRQFEDQLHQIEIYQQQLEFSKPQIYYKCLKYTSYQLKFIQSKSITFSYLCFLDYLKANFLFIKQQLYYHAIDLLKGLIHCFRVTLKIKKMMIVLLYTISIFIRFYGCIDVNQLKQITYLINVIRNFPGTIGIFACDLFQELYLELKTPGYMFRKQLRQQCIFLDVKKPTLNRRWINLIGNVPSNLFDYNFNVNTTNIRKLAIYNIMGCCGISNLENWWKKIEIMDDQCTYVIYTKILKILEITNKIDNYQSIRNMQIQSIQQLLLKNIKIKQEISKADIEELNSMVYHKHPLKYFEIPLIEIESSSNFNIKSLPNVQISTINLQTQQFYQMSAGTVLIGNDKDIGKIINNLGIFFFNLQLNSYKRMSFYLLPLNKENCSIAEYISHQCLWYNRFIYNVFKEKNVFPEIDLRNISKQIFLHYLYNRTLEMYIRQASRKVPIRIFKCKLKLAEIDDEITTYFCSHVLIGASLEFQMINMGENESNQLQYLEFYLERAKKGPNSLKLSIEVTSKLNNNKQLITKNEKNILIDDIQICNVPREYFMGHKPNPLDQYIEMSILTQHNAKSMKRELLNKDNFKKNNQYEIRRAFMDLFINVSAKSIHISNLNSQLLTIIIDGNVINKVEQMTIEAALTTYDLPMTFPVRCFLPFDEND